MFLSETDCTKRSFRCVIVHLRQTVITVITDIVTALVTRKDLCEVRIRTGQTEVAVFTAYEPEE
ncbi:hypothetical protein AWP48_26460 [Escherichia coli]|nr:hypothetical protein AWP48_26460 [Escherichia coli]